MPMDGLELNGWIWLVWSSCWFLAAALARGREKYRETALARLKHTLPTITSFLLIFFFPVDVAGPRLVAPAAVYNLLTLSGLLYAIWARICLGRNWSGVITLKKDHKLILRGPYRLTRHPIYTGFLLATLGSAIGAGHLPAALGFLLMCFTYERKVRREERVLRQEFGERYALYQKSTPRLIPLLRSRT